MALPTLSEEQVRTLTVEEKDRWWLRNVYRGDVPQFTLRAVLCGIVLGGLLSITNLYIGAKTGWALGVGITSVVLAFVIFKVLESIGLARNYHVLENNIVQSVACSAGYTNGPLIASMSAYMIMQKTVVPWWQMILWCFGLAVLGVLFAFPLKRRFINDEQLPFPEGQAAGVVLETLHSEEGDAAKRVLPAKLLVIFGLIAAVLKLAQSSAVMARLKLGFLRVPEMLDEWYYRLAAERGWRMPSINGTSLKELTIRPELDIAMIAAGGLMGIRTGVSLLVGAILCYGVVAPPIIARDDIKPQVAKQEPFEDSTPWMMNTKGIAAFMEEEEKPVGTRMLAPELVPTQYGFRQIMQWGLWCGVSMMTTASLVSFFAKPSALIKPFRSFLRGERREADCLEHIEFPLWLTLVGVPVVGAGLVYMAATFYGVPWWMAALAVPMVFVFTLIAVNSTALTSITPTGALGKITQLTYGIIAPGQLNTNIVTACISAEVAGSASNLIQNTKPGYMLGAKPRLQAIGHIVGAAAGATCSVAVFYKLFLMNNPAGLINDKWPYPAATAWKAVAELLTKGLTELPLSAQYAALVGAVAGILLEIVRMATKGRFWLSPVGVGLAFIIPFNTCFAMFIGSLLFWLAGKAFPRPEQKGNEILVQNQESICAGGIAGAALMGVALMAVELFVLKA